MGLSRVNRTQEIWLLLMFPIFVHVLHLKLEFVKLFSIAREVSFVTLGEEVGCHRILDAPRRKWFLKNFLRQFKERKLDAYHTLKICASMLISRQYVFCISSSSSSPFAPVWRIGPHIKKKKICLAGGQALRTGTYKTSDYSLFGCPSTAYFVPHDRSVQRTYWSIKIAYYLPFS